MRILILGFTKVNYMPYINLYLNTIDTIKNDVHTVIWLRDMKPDTVLPDSITQHNFEYQLDDSIRKIMKVRAFLKYRQFVVRILHTYCFDKVVILHTLPGITILDKLIFTYSKRYLLDFRDSTYERYRLFKRIVHILVENSFATFISSDAFRKYLPTHCRHIYTIHNLQINYLEQKNSGYWSNLSPIVIAFWGLVRHFEVNKAIITALANDQRFELHYHGRIQGEERGLAEIANNLKATNIFFHDEYFPDEVPAFARKTSIVHNIYDNNDDNMRIAISNKYYDAMVFGIPQLCMEGSYLADRVMAEGVGLACNPFSGRFGDDIFDYYSSINKAEFQLRCSVRLSEIIVQMKCVIDVIGKNFNE